MNLPILRQIILMTVVSVAGTSTAFADTPVAAPAADAPADPVVAPTTEPAGGVAEQTPEPKQWRRFTVGFGVAMPFYDYAKPKPGVSITFTPADKQQVVEILAAGYAISPKLSIAVDGVFIETFHDATMGGTTGFAFGGVAAIANYKLWRGLGVGLGPMVWFRKYFSYEADYGLFATIGYSIPLPKAFGLRFAVSTAQGYVNRPVVAVGAGLGITKSF